MQTAGNQRFAIPSDRRFARALQEDVSLSSAIATGYSAFFAQGVLVPKEILRSCNCIKMRSTVPFDKKLIE